MKYYVKDLKTQEVHEFNRPIEAQRFTEMNYRIQTAFFEKKQVVKDRYVLSLDHDFTPKQRVPTNQPQDLIIELNGETIKTRTTLKQVSEEYGVSIYNLRQSIDTHRLILGKLRVFTSEDKIVPLRKIKESYRKFYIFDALEEKKASTTCTLRQLSERLGCTVSAIHNSIHRHNKIKNRYVVSYKEITQVKQRKNAKPKKVDKRLIDVRDLKPVNSRIKRIGKEIIKERLNNIK